MMAGFAGSPVAGARLPRSASSSFVTAVNIRKRAHGGPYLPRESAWSGAINWRELSSTIGESASSRGPLAGLLTATAVVSPDRSPDTPGWFWRCCWACAWLAAPRHCTLPIELGGRELAPAASVRLHTAPVGP